MIIMLYLVLDTSASIGFVALFENEKLLSAKTIPTIELSSELMKAVEMIFLENEKTVQQLDFIACGIGPGSFTGTRIGIVSTKAIAYSLNLPIVEFCSLISFTPKGYASLNKFTIITDARSNQIYLLDCNVSSKGPHFADPKHESIDSIASIENGFSSDPQILEQHKMIEKSSCNLEFLGDFVYKKYLKGELTTASELRPIYLKSP